MSGRVALLLALLAAVAAADEFDEAALQIADEGRVTARGVGYASIGPTVFFSQCRILLETGTSERLLGLLDQEDPAVRCAALACLAESGAKGAKEALLKHLPDAGLVEYGPGGCVFYLTTVGGVARELLEKPQHLGAGRKDGPSLLTPEESRRLDLTMLAGDRTWGTHEFARRRLRKLALDLPSLRRLAPDLTDLALVKAVGRLAPKDTGPRTAFLQAAAKAPDLTEDARRAARSATESFRNEEIEPDDPRAVQKLLDRFYTWHMKNPRTRGAPPANRLAAMARRLPEVAAPWHHFAEAPWLLLSICDRWRMNIRLALPAEQFEATERLLHAACGG